ncbi:DUF4870 domain-containing protein [Pseudomonas jilinensis]|uniref:DUF4870 domain-containing protein n=1 Tax=Pseudomonas jilinensis TaxID=2078689 RepID=A0A396RVR3_9PSED|nr:DUF4870 domain-containing protein [Pseudomonas jilinensis]RHW20688.1 DUF4870 domain-containing protein [Pseudomonas jilinensis]
MTDEQPQPAVLDSPSPDARRWAMFAHLAGFAGYLFPFVGNLIAPLLVWQLKKDSDPFVDDQGKEALNFQISVSLAAILSFMLMVVLVGFVLIAVVVAGAVVLMIIAAIKANEGKAYRYPFCWRIIK